MKKTIINTGGALAVAAISVGLSVCSTDVQAAACTNTDFLVDAVTGTKLDMSAAMTLANNAVYLPPATACTAAGAITIPASAKVTIADSGGYDFTTNKIIMAAGSTLTYYCATGTCKNIIDAPASGTAPIVNLVSGGGTLYLADGTNPTRLTVNANSDLTLSSSGITGLSSTVTVAAGKTVTLNTLTTLNAATPATSKIITSGAATTILHK